MNPHRIEQAATRGLRTLADAFTIGALAGVLEGAFYMAKSALTHVPDWAHSADALWMTPAAVAVTLTLLAIPLAALHAGIPKLVTGRVVRFALVGVALLPLLRVMMPGVHPVAAAILSAGVAVVASGGLSRWDPTPRSSGLIAGVLAVLIPVTGAGFQLAGSLAETRALRSLPDADPDAPRVLLLILDTVRALNLGLYGYDRPTTPELQAFAHDALVFDRTLAPSPWTLPSHASLFTGRWPADLSVGWRSPLDNTYPTLAEELAGRGFATTGFVANLYYASRAFGLDRGFIHYDDLPVSLEMAVRRSRLSHEVAKRVRRRVGSSGLLARKSAEDINAAFLHWLEGLDPDRPFFAFLNYYDAHEPYRPPAPWARSFTRRPVAHLDPEKRHSPENLADYRATYDGALSYLDHEIGQLLRALERAGLLDRTLVIITSDHGEEFGRHGVIDHGNSLYYPSLHVPLVVRPPGGSGSESAIRITQEVSLVDLPATVMGLVGPGAPGRLGGESLMRHVQRGPGADIEVDPIWATVARKPWDVPEWFPIHSGDMRSLTLGGLHYIRAGDGSEELYDIRRDPFETENLATAATHAGALVRLRRLLDARSRPGADPG